MARPDKETIISNLSYNINTGIIVWKKDRRTGKVKAGEVAGWDNGNGYRRIEINGQRAYAHHIAWLLLTGEWPADEIDHINGNPHDNRPCNLRQASRYENNRNTRTRKHNSCGIKGITYDARYGVWYARITLNKKRTHLGSFETSQAAYQAYCDAAKRMHGEFARLS